jgi:hypothetical protein
MEVIVTFSKTYLSQVIRMIPKKGQEVRNRASSPRINSSMASTFPSKNTELENEGLFYLSLLISVCAGDQSPGLAHTKHVFYY